MAPSGELEPPRRVQVAALVVTALLPLAIAFVCSRLLSGNPLVKPVYAVAKTVQLALPLLWAVLVERRAMRFGRPTSATLGAALVSGIGLAALVLVVYGFGFRAEILASEVPAHLRVKLQGYGIGSDSAFVGFAAYHVVANTLAEEYYWRWFFFARLRALTSLATATAGSSVVFTMHHVFAVWWNGGTGSSLVVVAAVIASCGAVWARLYARSGTLYVPWLSHALVEVALLTIAYDVWRA